MDVDDTISESNTHFRRLTDRWTQAVWESDARGMTMADSPSWRSFTGQSPDEWLRYGWSEAIHPQDRQAVLASWNDAIAGGSVLDVEFRIRTRAGTWEWTNARAIPVHGSGGTVEKWVGVNIDIGARRKAEIALRASEERYRLMIENAIDYVIITVNLQGLIVSWSPGAVAAFGWPAASALRKPFAAVCRRAPMPGSARRIGAGTVSQSDPKNAMPGWYLKRDGSAMYLEGTSRALPGAGYDEPHVLIIGKDVTAQRHMEQELSSSEARYRNLVESVRDHSIFLTDEHGIITEWTTAAEDVTGYTASEMVGAHLSFLYTPESIAAGEVRAELDESAHTGKAEREGWRVQKDGRRIWCEEVTTAIRDRFGTLTGYSKVGRDVTMRRRDNEAKESERRQQTRNQLRSSLAVAEEEERRRLARDLHDTAGQHVTALSLGLRTLGDLVAANAAVQKHVAGLRDLAATLSEELHDVATRLRPRALDDFGLEDAIRAAAQSWSRHSGITASVHINCGIERLPAALENALYRIVQEALTNVARHSGAKGVSIVIERPDGHIMAIVEDDGIGFDPVVQSRAGQRGLGLVGIYERAESLGGTVEIESEPGKGTALLIRIPLTT